MEGLLYYVHFVYNTHIYILSSAISVLQNCDLLSFLGAFEKLRKATISFVMSVCPSVRTEQLGYHWTKFPKVLNLRIFRKYVEEFSCLHRASIESKYFLLFQLMKLLILTYSMQQSPS
jgi:hypothetical protein